MSDEDSESISLKVSKAIPSDVGHGRARISGENGLDLKPGDIIEIKGENRSTAAIYWRSRPEDAKMDIIRVDGIIRKNAGVSLGDRVTVSKVDAKICTKLVLSPVMANKQKVKFGPGIEGFARRGLNKRPVVAGDRIFIPGMTLFAEALPFAVLQTTPKGIVQVNSDTDIVLEGFPRSANTFSYVALKNIEPKKSSNDKDKDKEETSALGSLGLKPKPAV